MQTPPPGMQKVEIPAHVLRQIQAQIQAQLCAHMANAIVDGDYEGSEIISAAHKMIIGDMLLTLSMNKLLETAPCEYCQEIRLEHPLDLETGFRVCKDEHQVKDEDTKRFQPKMQERSLVVAPTAAEKSKLKLI